MRAWLIVTVVWFAAVWFLSKAASDAAVAQRAFMRRQKPLALVTYKPAVQWVCPEDAECLLEVVHQPTSEDESK